MNDNNPINQKVYENKLRRWCKRLGLKLVKSRAKAIHLNDFGGYQIVDGSNNMIVSGNRFDLDLDDVQDFLTNYEARLIEEYK